jgi:hypothetical protein
VHRTDELWGAVGVFVVMLIFAWMLQAGTP